MFNSKLKEEIKTLKDKINKLNGEIGEKNYELRKKSNQIQDLERKLNKKYIDKFNYTIEDIVHERLCANEGYSYKVILHILDSWELFDLNSLVLNSSFKAYKKDTLSKSKVTKEELLKYLTDNHYLLDRGV